MGSHCRIGSNTRIHHIDVEVNFHPYTLYNLNLTSCAANPRNKECVEKVIFRTLKELNKPIDFEKSIGFSFKNSIEEDCCHL